MQRKPKRAPTKDQREALYRREIWLIDQAYDRGALSHEEAIERYQMANERREGLEPTRVC